MAEMNKSNDYDRNRNFELYEESLQEIENSPGVTIFDWVIENYESKQDILLRSPQFHVKGDPAMEWYMSLFKRFNTNCHSCRVRSIGLRIHNTAIGNNFAHPVKVNFSIGIRSKGKLFSRTMRLTRAKVGANYGFYYFISEDELLNYLFSSGCLHIRLEISPLRNKNVDKPLNTIDNNFHPFLTNEALSDVVFHVDNYEFPAHKVILSSASSVFNKMFSHDMIENVSNEVHVQETDPNVFKEMLRYIYTGKVENLESVAFFLFELANKYDISGLRFICEECLLNTLTDDTVINILELADYHNSVILKKECIEYIDKHFESVRTTEAFETIKRDLLVELLCTVRAKKVRIQNSSP